MINYQDALQEFWATPDLTRAIRDQFDPHHAEDIQRIPEHLRGQVARYVFFGVQPTRYLTAVIQNDLFRTMQIGDTAGVLATKQIVEYFANCVPSAASGSPEAMQAWEDSNGLWGQRETA